MKQEKVMIMGKELRPGCVVMDDEGDYFKILGFCKIRYSQTEPHKTQEEAEKDNEPWSASRFSDRELEIISYPILGQDKNGDDVRLFDWVREGGLVLKERKVLGRFQECFLLEYENSWIGRYINNCTLVKPPNTLIGKKTATITINVNLLPSRYTFSVNGKSYKVEVKEQL